MSRASSVARSPRRCGAGFIGGLVTGFLAGVVARWIARLEGAAWARGLMPVVVIPLLSTLISAGLLIIVLGSRSAAHDALTSGLNNMSGSQRGRCSASSSALMMGFDLGGPVNKVGLLLRHRRRLPRPARRPTLPG